MTTPIDMILFCPHCGHQHIDKPESGPVDAVAFEEFPEPWDNPPHRSHKCRRCSHIWRPADVETNGVEEIKTKGKLDHFPIRKQIRNRS